MLTLRKATLFIMLILGIFASILTVWQVFSYYLFGIITLVIVATCCIHFLGKRTLYLRPKKAFNMLCDELQKWNKKDATVSLCRALHQEFYEGFCGIEREAYQKYRSQIEVYIEEENLDDRTIFGCPGDIGRVKGELSRTLNSVRRFYFLDVAEQRTLKKTKLGFSIYLRGFSLFLIGARKKSGSFSLQSGFLFCYNSHDVPSSAIVTHSAKLLQVMDKLWEQIVRETEMSRECIPLSEQNDLYLTQQNNLQLFRTFANGVRDILRRRFGADFNVGDDGAIFL